MSVWPPKENCRVCLGGLNHWKSLLLLFARIGGPSEFTHEPQNVNCICVLIDLLEPLLHQSLFGLLELVAKSSTVGNELRENA